jgi:murein DD-endopeptidase MepM/ murein hydrolase activator NlpD
MKAPLERRLGHFARVRPMEILGTAVAHLITRRGKRGVKTRSRLLSGGKLLLLVSLVCTLAVADEDIQLFPHESEPHQHPIVDSETPAPSNRLKNYDWPVKLISIGNSIASYQNYGGAPYFHHGLDIRANEGAPVRSSTAGVITSVRNYMAGPKYWEVAVKDKDGYTWQYHHLDPDTIPASIKRALKTHTPIPAGTLLGRVVRWSETNFGEVYNHLHLNVMDKDGTYLNPFAFLKSLKDETPPKIGRIALVKNGRAIDAKSVSGNYGLCVEVGDRILGNRYTVPPNKIKYSIDGGPQRTVWEFKKLPGGKSNTRFVNDFFVRGTEGSYNRQKFLINLAFKTKGKIDFPKEQGKHKIEVTVEDFEGNQTSKTFVWQKL